jgi:hypothetical protein
MKLSKDNIKEVLGEISLELVKDVSEETLKHVQAIITTELWDRDLRQLDLWSEGDDIKR